MTNKKTIATTKTPAKTTTKRVEKPEVKSAQPATELAQEAPAAKKPTRKAIKAALEAKVEEIAATKPATKAKAAKPNASTAPAKKTTKGDILIGLMRRTNGATAAELQKAAGWQAHSVRGFISAVLGKKLGLNVASAKNEAGERVYSIAK